MVCFTIIDYYQILKRVSRLFVLVISISIASPAALLCQVPDLGTAVNFAIFTSSGAVTNTGTTTKITGNLGTKNVGGITGYGGTNVVIGTEYTGVNATTNQCGSDVAAAHTDLDGRASVAHADTYGSIAGETLTPGVYEGTTLGTTLLSHTVILDAVGDKDAVFIIQTKGAFNVAANAEVQLIRGAQACHVYWVASASSTAGAMSIGADAIMKGTLITDLGAVSMGANANLEGRMLTLSGAATTVAGDTILIPSCLALPIELISFKGNRSREGNAFLKWSTASEINNDFFTIERSSDAVNWEVAGTDDGAGNSTEQIEYEFTDFSCPNEATYYRLKQTDFDENFKYEAKILIQKHKYPNQLFIHIDPLNNYLNIVNKEGEEDIEAIHIYNIYGEETYRSTNNESRIDISNFKNGSYLISIYLKSEIRTLKFIVYKN
jgi:hypothetical protein